MIIGIMNTGTLEEFKADVLALMEKPILVRK